MYQADVIKISNIEAHPNADRLDIITFNGETFITGKGDFSIGDTAVLFPNDGRISEDFLSRNNLYRHTKFNVDVDKKGYFGDNAKVTMEKLRGINSYGLIVGLEAFSYLGVEFPYKPGDSFDSISGKQICEKYYSPATLAQMRHAANSKKKTVIFDLAKHYDTTYLTYAKPNPGLVIITEKLHGTSGRTGRVLYKKIYPSLWERIKNLFTQEKYMVVTGTRNTVCVPGWAEQSQEEKYRVEIHNQLKDLLHRGETVFYEIVGFNSNGKPIMNPHNTDKVKDKAFKNSFPNPIIYKYATCTYEFYVYRITQEIEGTLLELSWDQILNRCEQLGIKPVPELDRFYYYGVEPLNEYLAIQTQLNNSPSTLDSEVLREGICIRVENSHPMIYKAKNFMFGVLEGWAKESDTYVDTEEIN